MSMVILIFLSFQRGVISRGGIMPFFVSASGFAGAKKIGSVEFGTVGAMNMYYLIFVPMSFGTA